MPPWLADAWPIVATILVAILDVLAAGHALLHRREPRAALLWVGLIAFAPLMGALLYWIFGLNRLERRGHVLREGMTRLDAAADVSPVDREALAERLPEDRRHLAEIERVLSHVARRSLLPGNAVRPLVAGREAYGAMLQAIDEADRTIVLATYIFDRDEVGRAFVSRLAAARARGVEVRVLVDDAGTHYSWPRIVRDLKEAELPYGLFNRRLRILPRSTLNLRLHRKLLVADGRVGFTGGMNIRAGHQQTSGSDAVADLHFRVEGPVVAHLHEVFAEDWAFTTGEHLQGDLWTPRTERSGEVLARAIAAGPDEDFGHLRWTLLGALATARHRVRIVTPYFVPDADLIAALAVTALRGVDVEILLPSRPNLRVVGWASQAMWWQVLEHGVRIRLSPPPFDHAKLLVVDGHWVLLGSANWDARSLRLNFELNLACWDEALAARCETLLDERAARAEPVTLEQVDARGLPTRLRDGAARLLAPIL